MNIFCIVSCAFLIATVGGQYSTPNSDYPYEDYYNDPDDNKVEDNRLEEVQNVQDSSLQPTFVSKPQRVVVQAGQNATLRCKTKNAGDYVLMWKRDAEIVTVGGIVRKPDLYTLLSDNTSLVIKNVKESLTGSYSCVIQTSQDPKPTLTHRLKLENDAEVISLKAEDNVTKLYPGDTLRLTCKVEGDPVPTIKWSFKGNDQNSSIDIRGNKVKSSEMSDTLVIENVNFKNNGTYRCTADNEKSFDHQSIVIEVFDETIYLEIKKLYDDRKLRGLECIVKRSKSKVDYLSWQSESNFSLVNINRNSHNSITLIFYDISESNSGKYSCVAKNKDGVTEQSVDVQKPTKPFFERLLRLKNDSYNITLVWKLHSSFPIIDCLIFNVMEYEYLPYSLPVTVRKEGLDSYFIFHSQYLSFDAFYAFKITCQNGVGWSEVSNIQYFELTDDPIYIEIQKLYRQDILVALDCVLLFNESQAILSWEKDGAAIPEERIGGEYNVEHTNKSIMLIFQNKDISNSGEYVCIARHYDGAVKRYIYLKPPGMPINLEFSKSNLKWRIYSVYPILECKVQYGKVFGPLEKLDRSVSIGREEFDSYLILYVPAMFLKGKYEFIISCRNEDGWSTKSEIKTIEFRVKPIIVIQKIYSKKKLSGLNCMIQAANPSADIIWKKDDELLNSSYSVYKTKNSFRIKFNNDDDSDFGTYTCIAKNFEGATREDVVFQRPLRPIFRELLSSDRDTIIWTVSSREPLIKCIVFYINETEEHESKGNTQIKQQEGGYVVLHTPSFPYGGIYRFKVKCLSKSDYSDESEEKSLTIRDKGRDAAASHTDSRISRGLQIAPSLMVILITFMIMNP